MEIQSIDITENGRTVYYSVDIVVDHNGKEYEVSGVIRETYDMNNGDTACNLETDSVEIENAESLSAEDVDRMLNLVIAKIKEECLNVYRRPPCVFAKIAKLKTVILKNLRQDRESGHQRLR